MSESQSYASASFPSIFSEGAQLGVPMGTTTAPAIPGREYFQFADAGSGRIVHAFADGPFAFTGRDGAVHSMDTSLRAVAGGYAPTSVPYDITIPPDFSTGVTWTAQDGRVVRISPMSISHGNNYIPAVIAEGAPSRLIYPGAWHGTDVIAVATPQGVKDHFIVRDVQSAPNRFRFRIDRPATAMTMLTADGGVKVADGDGTILAVIPPPHGWDATQHEFATSYTVSARGNHDEVELVVDTSPITEDGATVTFAPPYDIDPTVYTADIIPGVNASASTSGHTYASTSGATNTLNAQIAATAFAQPNLVYAKWAIAAPPAGAAWVSFSADVSALYGQFQKYILEDESGNAAPVNIGPAALPGTAYNARVTFPNPPAGGVYSTIRTTSGQTTGPLYNYYGNLSNIAAVYEDLVDPAFTGLGPLDGSVQGGDFTGSASFTDTPSGCGNATVSVYDQAGNNLGTRASDGCVVSHVYSPTSEGAYTIQATVHDRSGRASSASNHFTVDFPINPPTPIDDGIEDVDVEVTNDGTTMSASWDAAPLATAYEVCFTTATTCTDTDRWTQVQETEASVDGYSFADGNRVYACVRSVGIGGIRTTPACSNGVLVDTSPPQSPEAVWDGPVPGVDGTTTENTSTTTANWPPGSDSGSGVVGYDTCLTTVGEPCAESDWVDDLDSPGALSNTVSGTLTFGTNVSICVRSIDAAGNTSTPLCSTGQHVTPDSTELSTAATQRQDLGLPGNVSMIRDLFEQPSSQTAMDTIGTPATPTELATVATTFAQQDASRTALDSLSSTLGDSLGYVYFSHHGKQINVLLSMDKCNLGGRNTRLEASNKQRGENAAHKMQVVRRALRGTTGGNRLRLSIKWIHFSNQCLTTLRDKLATDRTLLAARGLQINEVTVDPKQGVVVIHAPSVSQAVRTYLKQNYGRPIEIENGGAAVDTRSSSKTITRSSWYRLQGTFAVGTSWNDLAETPTAYGFTRCSTAFAAHDATGRPLILTAKHCFEHTVRATTGTLSQTNRDRLAMGVESSASPTQDVAGIVLLSPVTGSALTKNIYTKPSGRHRDVPNTLPIDSPLTRPFEGQLVCDSAPSADTTERGKHGTSNGVRCAKVTARNSWEAHNSLGESGIFDSVAFPACGGDSGTGVWRPTSVNGAWRRAPVGIVTDRITNSVDSDGQPAIDFTITTGKLAGNAVQAPCNVDAAYAPLSIDMPAGVTLLP